MDAISKLTPHQYYKGLNNRFDNRVKKLLKQGYKYNKELVGFVYKNFKNSFISNATIMHSDKRHFNYLLINTKI